MTGSFHKDALDETNNKQINTSIATGENKQQGVPYEKLFRIEDDDFQVYHLIIENNGKFKTRALFLIEPKCSGIQKAIFACNVLHDVLETFEF